MNFQGATEIEDNRQKLREARQIYLEKVCELILFIM